MVSFPDRTRYIQGNITLNPDICNGKPVIRGLRITLQTILEFLNAGETREEILKQYPSLQSEDIDTCLNFAKEITQNQCVVKKLYHST